MSGCSRCLALGVVLALSATSARAVIVAGDYGTTDEAPPTVIDSAGNNIGNNVGTFNSASGIYIGNGWMLTADHVGPGDPTFQNGVGTYDYDGTNEVRLTTPGQGAADMILFHLSSDPPLPNMDLSSTSGATLAANNTSVIMYGHGQSISSSTYYDTSTNPWTATSTPTPEAGYVLPGTGAAEVFRSGVNFVRTTALVSEIYGTNQCIVTYFNPNYTNAAGTHAMSQASLGDSGSAIFAQTSGGGYQLVGMTFAIGDDQNDDATNLPPAYTSAVYSVNDEDGDGETTADSTTYAADISVYLSQIEAVTGVPEPSPLWLSGVGAAACLGIRFRPVRARR